MDSLLITRRRFTPKEGFRSQSDINKIDNGRFILFEIHHEKAPDIVSSDAPDVISKVKVYDVNITKGTKKDVTFDWNLASVLRAVRKGEWKELSPRKEK